MTPDREKMIHWYWRVYRDQWHPTIGNEFKVDATKLDAPYSPNPARAADNVIVLPAKRDILTFRREPHLGHYRVVCEGIVVEME